MIFNLHTYVISSEQNDLVVMVISSSDEEDNAMVQRPTAAEVHVVDDIGPDSFVMTQFGDGVVSRYRCENSKHRNLSKVSIHLPIAIALLVI